MRPTKRWPRMPKSNPSGGGSKMTPPPWLRFAAKWKGCARPVLALLRPRFLQVVPRCRLRSLLIDLWLWMWQRIS